MTPVPSSLLRQTITIRDHQGATGTKGASFGEPRTVRARVTGRRRVVRTGDGSDVTSTQTATVRPGKECPTESQVIYDGATYEVAEVIPSQGLSRPTHFDLVLV